jgi:hypothetical protein
MKRGELERESGPFEDRSSAGGVQERWSRQPADSVERPRAQDCIAIVANDGGRQRRVVAWVLTDAEGGAGASNARLIESAPSLLAWLEKAVQMAGQQAIGGDDTPSSTAWAWLAEQAGAAVVKARGEVQAASG